MSVIHFVLLPDYPTAHVCTLSRLEGRKKEMKKQKRKKKQRKKKRWFVFQKLYLHFIIHYLLHDGVKAKGDKLS